MTVRPAGGRSFAAEIPVVVVGGGACGLVAALAAREAGAEVMVLERDRMPAGSTALSSGLIPAAGTRFQRELGLADTAEHFAADIMAKNRHRADPAIVDFVARAAGPCVEWLADRHGVPFSVVTGFLYPGHGAMRMHGTPGRTGRELMEALVAAAAKAGAEIVTSARVTTLFAAADGRIAGVGIERPDGAGDELGCTTLVLACNGYAGNPALVRRFIPDMAEALFFGHAGNQGDALIWGEALGGVGLDLASCQGHGSVAQPHGILITWALMMEGGIQVNAAGRRFSNEERGYSEQAIHVLAQPGGVAFDIYDERLHRLALQFEDYRQAEEAGAIRRAGSAAALASALALPGAALEATLAEIGEMAAGFRPDPYGRDFSRKPPLSPPFYGVRVGGALFHTQGGLAVDAAARVLRADGTALPNLFAGGGAARGVSGPSLEGYLSGNGLLTAITLGRAAGSAAASQALSEARSCGECRAPRPA